MWSIIRRHLSENSRFLLLMICAGLGMLGVFLVAVREVLAQLSDFDLEHSELVEIIFNTSFSGFIEVANE